MRSINLPYDVFLLPVFALMAVTLILLAMVKTTELKNIKNKAKVPQREIAGTQKEMEDVHPIFLITEKVGRGFLFFHKNNPISFEKLNTLIKEKKVILSWKGVLSQDELALIIEKLEKEGATKVSLGL